MSIELDIALDITSIRSMMMCVIHCQFSCSSLMDFNLHDSICFHEVKMRIHFDDRQIALYSEPKFALAILAQAIDRCDTC